MDASIRTLRRALVFLALVSLAAADRAQAGAGFVDADDGDIHLNFHFRFPPQEADIARVQAQASRASRILCDASDGRMRIASMRLTAGGAAEPAGDVWYQPPGTTPRSSAHGRLIENDGHVYLAHEDVRSDVFAHELGHLIWNLGDQYDEQRRMGGACGQGRSFELDAMDENNHTIMQQAGWQQCVTAGGVGTGRSCYDATDCDPGESCPTPALMSELSTPLNHDLLRGDEVLPENTCPAPRAGDTVSVGGWLGEDLPGGLFDPTSFATADATATRRFVTDWIDALGDVPGYDEGSAHALYVYAEHVALNAWQLHFAMDGKHFDPETEGSFVLLASCTAVMEAAPSFDVEDPPGTVRHHRRVATVNGDPVEEASCQVPIAGLANGAPDATLNVVFDEFSERDGTGGGTLKKTAFSQGTRILAGGFQQLGRCTETENCEMLWNTATERWETAATTRSDLRNDRPIQSDWTRLVDYADEVYGLDIEPPAGLPDLIEPIPCAIPVEFDVDVEGADQVIVVVDRSGSMRTDREYVNDTRTRLDWAKAGVRGFANLVAGTGMEIALLSFDGDVVEELGLAPVVPTGSGLPDTNEVAEIVQAVDALEHDGTTAIGDALDAAGDLLAAEADGRTQAVLLLSDGENMRGADPLAVANELRDAGVTVYTMPVGDAAGGEQLSQIAERTSGEMYEAPTGLELPTIYADLYARLRGETPLATRTPLSLDPGGPTTPGPPVDVPIHVEPGATRLDILLSNRNDLGHTWAPGFRLLAPGGAQVLTHTHPSVVNDAFYRLARVAAPQPGDWTLVLFSTNPIPQQLYYWIHLENPLPDCWASASSAEPETGSPAIQATASFQDALGRGTTYTAEIEGPNDVALHGVPLSLDESLAGARTVLSGVHHRGRYDVVVRCEATSSARLAPGEQADTESVLAQPRPPPFTREARTSFFLDTPGFPPYPDGSDCDHDGISNSSDGMTTDADGDGLPNACDSDADNDELPDADEPAGDLDGDGSQDFLDADADGDGVRDDVDDCVGPVEQCPEPVASGLVAALALGLLARSARDRRRR